MAKKVFDIDENFCFSFRSGNLQTKMKALEYYQSNKVKLEKWWQSDKDVPLVLDTNVLLNAYSYSVADRSSFIKFLTQNKNRIYILDQADEEFQRNRHKHVPNYKKNVTSQLSALGNLLKERLIFGFCDNLILRLENLAKNNIVHSDYPNESEELCKAIDRIKEWRRALNAPCQALQTDIEEILRPIKESMSLATNHDISDDDLILSFSLCQFGGKLSDKEKNFIIDLYCKCLEAYDLMKGRPDNIDMSMYTFPGLKDREKEKENKQREGDFLMYHEMLKMIKSINKDVIFITSDLSKGDTAGENGEPYDHYITNCYALTGHVYYLADGKSLPLSSILMMLDDTDYDDEMPSTTVVSASVTSLDSSENINSNMLYRTLTKDEFLHQFDIYMSWARDYGGGLVSKEYFIYTIMGHKRYRYADSRRILQSLIEENVLRIVETADGKECIERV